ncbi:MAG TPA: hypothetical protein VKA46_38960, partial [Gemmataceae bacterium]|nr:hypothetical protein [Gemmataceae bacterium]
KSARALTPSISASPAGFVIITSAIFITFATRLLLANGFLAGQAIADDNPPKSGVNQGSRLQNKHARNLSTAAWFNDG